MSVVVRRAAIWGMLLAGCMTGLMGCKDLAGTPPLPAGTTSPGIVQNATGAIQTAVAAEAFFQQAFASYIPISGELTDELQANGRGDYVNSGGSLLSSVYGDVIVDSRQLDQSADWNPPLNLNVSASTDTLYGRLQRVRAMAYQAIGGLSVYAPDSLALRGKMYALIGYSEIMLADLYCSGVPLSTLDFQGDYTYKPSSATAQIYQHTIVVFDTALTLAKTNPQIVNLAKVGQGRAFLALGQYANAGQGVSAVPSTFLWNDSITTCGNTGNECSTASIALVSAYFSLLGINKNRGYSVSDREAGSGLPFASSGDPRTADTVVGSAGGISAPQYFPKKYNITGISILTLASGLEAQLIVAEADLNTGNSAGMFNILNALRASNPATAGLPKLTDPGTFGAEVDTLFTERAAWLFVDGHRQGDLRRLMRNYVAGQGVQVVDNQYPSGDYGFGVGLYGSFIDAPIPALELINPHFTGCLSRD